MGMPFRNKGWRSFGRDASGAVAIEFAFLAIPFFLLIFSTIETAIVMGAGILLDNAVDDLARQVMTGQIQAGDVNEEAFRIKLCDQVDFLLACKGDAGKSKQDHQLRVDLRTFPAFGDIPKDVPMLLANVDTTGFCFDPGAENGITVLRAYYDWPWTAAFLQKLTEDTEGEAILVSLAAFMNEPFGEELSKHSNCP